MHVMRAHDHMEYRNHNISLTPENLRKLSFNVT